MQKRRSLWDKWALPLNFGQSYSQKRNCHARDISQLSLTHTKLKNNIFDLLLVLDALILSKRTKRLNNNWKILDTWTFRTLEMFRTLLIGFSSKAWITAPTIASFPVTCFVLTRFSSGTLPVSSNYWRFFEL